MIDWNAVWVSRPFQCSVRASEGQISDQSVKVWFQKLVYQRRLSSSSVEYFARSQSRNAAAQMSQ